MFGGGTPGKGAADKEQKGIDLSENKDLSSFAALSRSDTPIFGQKTDGFSFAGTEQSVFGSGKKVTNGGTHEDNDEDHPE